MSSRDLVFVVAASRRLLPAGCGGAGDGGPDGDVCGDGTCAGSECCESCAQDCGA